MTSPPRSSGSAAPLPGEAAPGRAPDPVPPDPARNAPPRASWSARAWRWCRDLHRDSVATGAFWPTLPSLVFLLLLVVPAWGNEVPWRALAITVLALLVGFTLIYAAAVRGRGVRTRTLWLVGTWAITGLLAAVSGWDVLYLCMYTIMVNGMVLPWRVSRIVVPAISVAYGVAGLLTGNYYATLLALSGMAMALAIAFGIDRAQLERRLKQAETRSAVLAVAAERERIGRDLHDILCHSLTTVTTLAQLGRRLADTDPAAAAEQFDQIERISRSALADVRATASNMRQVSAASEVASARSVLQAAGIVARVPAAVPDLPPARAELFGYVIREGVTNVVRHSRAGACTITVAPDAVTIADDGRGVGAEPGEESQRNQRSRRRSSGAQRPGAGPGADSGPDAGSGIAGLRARVAAAGGTLTVEPGPGGVGTALSAQMPEVLSRHDQCGQDSSLRILGGRDPGEPENGACHA